MGNSPLTFVEDVARDWITDFALFKLGSLLTEFDVGDFEGKRIYEWFWRTAPSWRKQASRASFDVYARERIADHVGYSRRRANAFNIVDRLFDKGDDLTLDEVIGAVMLLAPTQPFPFEIFENNGYAILDLKQSSDRKNWRLVVDIEFLPLLKQLYPFERVGDQIVKEIPVGSTFREIDLLTIAFWWRYPNANREERERAVTFHSADRLDWSSGNLYSRWREGLSAQRYAARFDPVPEDTDRNGRLSSHLGTGGRVDAPQDLLELLIARWELPAKPTATGEVRNKTAEDLFERTKAASRRRVSR